MVEIRLLSEVALITVAGAAVTVALSRLRMPVVTGLIAAGALIGPFALGLIRDVSDLEKLAEVGVILLMFTIGLEFSFERLKHIFRRVALGGLIQVAGTIAAAGLAALALDHSPQRALFLGFIFALSSTAIVLRALSQRGELDAPHGRFIVGTLIFQDLCVVPMVLIVPVLASNQASGQLAVDLALALGKASVVVAGAALAAKYVVPWVLRTVDASRSREVFLLAILAMCVGTAWLTSLAGLSLALGAFLGGMVVGGTEFQHRALGNLIPLRDAFVSIFFVSLGTLLDVKLLAAEPLKIALLFAGFVAGKAAIATLAAAAMKFPARAAWLAGAGLGQFGEFGFVLVTLGVGSGLLEKGEAGVILAAGVLSMFLTPVLIRLAPHLTAGERLVAPLSRILGVRGIDQEPREAGLSGHVVLIGYGLAGASAARALAASGLAHVALELNAETVRRALEAGGHVFYADATSEEALGHAGLERAAAAVVLINDPEAVLRVVDTIRRVAPSVPVIVRTRYLLDRSRLEKLGAFAVVSEEVEATIEVVARMLRLLDAPRNVIDARIREIREEFGTSARKPPPAKTVSDHAAISGLVIESLVIDSASLALGKTIRELEVRKNTGALVLALTRGGGLVENPGPDEPFREGDVVYLAGARKAVTEAGDMLSGEKRG